MAFCVRSERKMEFQEKKPSIPGPGQYIKLSKKSKVNNKRFYPPFHTSAQRGPLIKINDNPGPGSYNLDSNNSNSLENINYQQKKQETIDDEENIFQDIIITNYNTNEKNNNNNSLMTNIIGQNSSLSNTSKHNNISLKKEIYKNRSLSLKDINLQNSKFSSAFISNIDGNYLSPISQNEKLGFLSKATRFNKKSDIDKASTPGPGSYYESINSTINDTKLKQQIEHQCLKAASLVEKTGSLTRIVSIPSKIMNGYIYDNKINKMNKTFANEQENSKLYNNSFGVYTCRNNNIFNNTFQNYSNTSNIINNNSNNDNTNPIQELKLLINESCLKSNNNFSGTNELVGPGSYDVSLIEKNNNIVNWSKGFNLKKINQKNELKKNLKLIEEMRKKGTFKVNNKNIFNKSNKRFLKLINPYQNKELLKLIKPNNLQNKIIESFRNSFIPDKSEIPGPGYYQNELIKPENDILKKREKYEDNKENNENQNKIKNKIPDMNYRKFQCGEIKNIENFGSLCERPINKSKSMEDLGPTTYFKQKNKYEPEKKNTIYKQLVLGKTQMSCTVRNNFDFYFPDIPEDKENNSKLKEDQNKYYKSKTNRTIKKINKIYNFNQNDERQNNSIDNNHSPLNLTIRSKSFYNYPGPGAYELSQTFIKPSFSTTQMMKSKVQRFSKNDDGNPGPGSYQNIKNMQFGGKIILKKIFDKKYKYNKSDIIKEKRIKKIIELNKRINEVPGTGTYNIDKRNSILYKIYSKFNFNQSYQSPFLNSSSRFTQNIKNNGNISPSSYEPYKYENIKKNNQYMVFNKAIRFYKDMEEMRQKDWFLAAPGSYDLEPEWNKKSYNVLFSGNQ